MLEYGRKESRRLAEKKTTTKITKYRRQSSVMNIGTIIFGIIFIYMIICIFLYITAKHITSYEVMAGSISGNYRYTALAIKEERIVTAPQSGNVTYYAREGARTGSGMTVCSIDENGTGTSTTVQDVEISADAASDLKDTMSSFALNFHDGNYQDVYNFKADLESYVLQLAQDQNMGSTTGINQCSAPESGFVVYSTDGMENLEENNLTEDNFNRNNYHRTNLRLNGDVKAGEQLYKLVTSESWAIYFPLSSSLVTELQDRSSVRFRFLKDNSTFSAPFSIIRGKDGYYGKISLNNSLARYVSERYLDIELLTDRKSGLKIPTSAIAEKIFYKIPEEYVIANKDTDNEITLLRESFNSDGSSSVKYLTATVYAKENGEYLVSTELFQDGDYVQMTDTTKKFQIQADNVETIQGVYNINKGYAVFREVIIVDENEEFCIVEPNNIYGLAAHDRIVLDASTVNADDIVY